jgi:plasmid stabilization system protein ParE
MKLRYTPEAVADLVRIAADIRIHNPAAALRVRAAILDSIQNLIVFPCAGRRQDAEGVRKLVTRKYFYLVYYTADDAAEETIILNIKHPAQRRERHDW